MGSMGDALDRWWARLRWRRRGAWQWPTFALLTVVDGALLAWLPFTGGDAEPVGALLVAGVLNLVVLAVAGPAFGWLLRRRRADLPSDVAADRAAVTAMLALTLALLAGAWAAQPIWVLDLGASDGRLLSGGETGQWAWGQPTVGPVTYGNLWGTNLNGPYLHDTTDWLQVTLPDLSGLSAPTLVLTHWYAVRAGDSALLQLDSGSGFIVLDFDPELFLNVHLFQSPVVGFLVRL